MFIRIRIICMSIVFLCVATYVYSQPNVNYIDGTMQDDKKIKISGSNFGNNYNPAPILYEYFEDGILGDKLSSDGWLVSDSDQGKYSDSNSRSGSQSAHWVFNKGAYYHHWKEINNQNTIYATYWYYNTGVHGNNVKSVRIGSGHHYTGEPRISTRVRVDERRGNTYSLCGDIRNGNGTVIDGYLGCASASHNQWIRIEQFMRLNDHGSSNGSYGFGVVGSSWEEKSNKTVRTSSSQFLNRLFIGQGIANYESPGHIYLDDLYTSNTLARVEIGNSSVFQNCTHREIQVLSAWTSNRIELTFNKGTFEDGDLVYLFVVDSDGNPSPGYGPFAIGGDGTIIEDSSLTAPQGLSIKIE